MNILDLWSIHMHGENKLLTRVEQRELLNSYISILFFFLSFFYIYKVVVLQEEWKSPKNSQGKLPLFLLEEIVFLNFIFTKLVIILV